VASKGTEFFIVTTSKNRIRHVTEDFRELKSPIPRFSVSPIHRNRLESLPAGGGAKDDQGLSHNYKIVFHPNKFC
jgi:hypothetical protein